MGLRFPEGEVKPAPSIGTSKYVGSYELIAELARGGMGRVFLARRTGEAGFERLFAIKVLNHYMESEPEAVQMLLDEARIASQVHHPNVVPITDIGVHEGSYFVVMEYIEGCSLYELLRKNKITLQPRLIVPLIIDALHGLHGAHELVNADGESFELVHRDFSPHNLLIGVDGNCCVTDFGIAKASARLTNTRPDVQKGKISYMAPEQLMDVEDLDRRADIWAAGVVLWYALTGEHPFRSDSEASTVHAILHRALPLASTQGLKPPQCFDGLVHKALEHHRERRFQSAAEMADELQAIAVDHKALAPRSEVGDWIRSSFRGALAERRERIKALKRGGDGVAWIAPPLIPNLPGVSSTSSDVEIPERQKNTTGTRRVGSTRGRARLLVAVIAGSVLGFTLLFGGLVLNQSFNESDEVVTEQPAAGGDAPTFEVSIGPIEHPPASRESSERSEAEPPGDQRGDTSESTSRPDQPAQITLRGVPHGARVRLDGVTVEGSRFVIPHDGEDHVVRVSKSGFASWRRVVSGAAGNQVLVVELEPRGDRRHRETRGRREARNQSKQRPSPSRRAILDPFAE